MQVRHHRSDEHDEALLCSKDGIICKKESKYAQKALLTPKNHNKSYKNIKTIDVLSDN